MVHQVVHRPQQAPAGRLANHNLPVVLGNLREDRLANSQCMQVFHQPCHQRSGQIVDGSESSIRIKNQRVERLRVHTDEENAVELVGDIHVPFPQPLPPPGNLDLARLLAKQIKYPVCAAQ